MNHYHLLKVTVDEELKNRQPSEDINPTWPQIPVGFVPFKDCF